MTQPNFRGGGIAEALAAVARRLGVPFDAAALQARIGVHAEPQSLLALVEIARELGLVARGFQAEPSSLDRITFPAVAHLRDPSGAESFATLGSVSAEACELDDPSGFGTQRLARDAFESLWTGIVVTFERAAGSAPAIKAPGPFEVWRARLASDRQSATLDAGRAAAAVLAAVLALGAAARLGMAGAAIVLLDVVAAVACVALFHASRRTRVASATPRLAKALCGQGRLGDCEGVLGSKWARIGGFDVAVIGLAFAGSNLALALTGVLASPAMAASLFLWIGASHVLAAPASLFYIGLQVWPLRRFCPLCMTVHACVLGGALAAVLLWTGTVGTGPPAAFVAIGAVHLAAILAVGGLVVPYMESALETRANRARLDWISATPWGAMAEAAGRAAVFAVPPPAAFEVGEAGARFRIDALVHPFCSHCGTIVDRLAEIAARRAGLVHVAFHLPRRDLRDPADRELCSAIAAIGRIAGGDQTVHVFRAVKTAPNRWLKIARGGAERVIESFVAPGAPLEGVLPAARAAVARADEISALLRTGTPTVLIQGRPWESTLEDLDSLLESHVGVLSEALGVPLQERAGPAKEPAQ